jgi:hypothetical protein
MTISHRLRRTGDLDFNRAAKAFSYQTHNMSSSKPKRCAGEIVCDARLQGRTGIIGTPEGLGLPRPTMGPPRHSAGRHFPYAGLRGIPRSEDAEPLATG